jgi:hypothetical protein
MDSKTLTSRIADLIVEDVGEEALIYDTRTDVAHSLGATAAVVWRAARAGETLDGISALLRQRGEAAPDDMAVAVVAELQEKELLESRNFASPGISRRRALQRMAAVGAAAAAGSPASCKAQNVSCNPAGSLYANNDCCKLTTGNASDSMYCTAAATCQPCIPAGSTPSLSCVQGSTSYQCCTGQCRGSSGKCGP